MVAEALLDGCWENRGDESCKVLIFEHFCHQRNSREVLARRFIRIEEAPDRIRSADDSFSACKKIKRKKILEMQNGHHLSEMGRFMIWEEQR